MPASQGSVTTGCCRQPCYVTDSILSAEGSRRRSRFSSQVGVPCGAISGEMVASWSGISCLPVSSSHAPCLPGSQCPGHTAPWERTQHQEMEHCRAARHVLFTSEVLRPREVRGLAVLPLFIRGETSCIFLGVPGPLLSR